VIRISPSQINTWRTCPRRWWYDRNRERVQHPAAAEGERVHGVLENWLQYGTPPDLDQPQGRTAVAGLALIPQPYVAEVERPFALEYEGVTYSGRIDFSYGYVPGASVTIGDHKTTSNLARAKTPEELETDPQRVIYSYWATQAYGVAAVTARWVYYLRVTRSRKNGKAQAVELTEDTDTIARRMAELHESAQPLIEAKRLSTGPAGLTRDFSACHLYPPHGCPYARECLRGTSSDERAIGAILG